MFEMWNSMSSKLEASQSNTASSNSQLPQTSTNAAGSIKGSFSMYSICFFFLFYLFSINYRRLLSSEGACGWGYFKTAMRRGLVMAY